MGSSEDDRIRNKNLLPIEANVLLAVLQTLRKLCLAPRKIGFTRKHWSKPQSY